MQLLRTISCILMFTVAMIHASGSHARTFEKHFISPPAVEAKTDTKWHKLTFDSTERRYFLISLNAAGNPVVKMSSPRNGLYILQRYDGRNQVSAPIEEVVIEVVGSKQTIRSIRTVDKNAFSEWTKRYIDELRSNTQMFKSGARSEGSPKNAQFDDCWNKCEREFLKCAVLGITGFGAIICAIKQTYCIHQCDQLVDAGSSQSGSSSGTGSNVGTFTPKPHDRCLTEGCREGYQCCDTGQCITKDMACPSLDPNTWQ